MAITKISEATSVDSLAGTEKFPISDGTSSAKSATIKNVRDYVSVKGIYSDPAEDTGTLTIDETTGSTVVDWTSKTDGETDPLTVEFAGNTHNEYVVYFSGSNPIDFSSACDDDDEPLYDWKYIGDKPTFEAGKKYVASIQDCIIVYGEIVSIQ